MTFDIGPWDVECDDNGFGHQWYRYEALSYLESEVLNHGWSLIRTDTDKCMWAEDPSGRRLRWRITGTLQGNDKVLVSGVVEEAT